MLTLAIDTATEDIAAALAELTVERDDKAGRHATYRILACADGPAPRMANTQLVDRVQDMCTRAGAVPEDIGLIVCGRGPGSFTGVRIGVATAKGISLGLRVPLHGVHTLDAIAEQVWASGFRGELGVVGDAMRKEVYPARFTLASDGCHRHAVDTVAKPDVVASSWAGQGPLLLAGNGLLKYADTFRRLLPDCELADPSLWLPKGEGLIAALCADFRDERLDSGDPGSVLPLYTRLSDAEETERMRAGQGRPMLEDIPLSGVDGDAAFEGVVFRPMTRSDVAAVAALQRRAFSGISSDDAWSESLLDGVIDRGGYSWWVALRAGDIVGCAGGLNVDGVLNVENVAVDTGHRCHGIATQLLKSLANDAMALGITKLTLEVRSQNVAARKLYESLGLIDIGVRPHFYPDGAEAHILTGELPLGDKGASSRGLSDAEDAGAAPAVGGMRLAETSHDAPAEHPRPLILAIESSCDETAAAIIDGRSQLRSDVIASQIGFHARFGGVVPEIASRKHIEAIVGVAEEALYVAGCDIGRPDLDFKDLDGIAVTSCPGLVGALVVGIAFAKGLAWATGLPLIEVNHLEGHIYANRLITPDIEPPMVALLVSGGHTMLVHVEDWGTYHTLGATLDDAVGEAFDKVAKALGLGYPGGPVISRLAKQGNPKAIDFPRAMLHSGDLRFSLSGLKTAVITYIKQEQAAGRAIDVPDLAASFQQAVVDVLVAKTLTALEQTGAREFCLGGGVAANPELRESLKDAIEKTGVRVTLPPLSSCTDNAGMIAAVALARFERGDFSGFELDARAHAPLDQRY